MIAAALSSYRRPCWLCRDRDAVHVVAGGPAGYVVCGECAEDMPVEMWE